MVWKMYCDCEKPNLKVQELKISKNNFKKCPFYTATVLRQKQDFALFNWFYSDFWIFYNELDVATKVFRFFYRSFK